MTGVSAGDEAENINTMCGSLGQIKNHMIGSSERASFSPPSEYESTSEVWEFFHTIPGYNVK